jgi:hypothetical protein
VFWLFLIYSEEIKDGNNLKGTKRTKIFQQNVCVKERVTEGKEWTSKKKFIGLLIALMMEAASTSETSVNFYRTFLLLILTAVRTSNLTQLKMTYFIKGK